YLYLNTRKRGYLFIIALGLLSGYLVSIRSIGVVFPLAVLCHSLVLAHKSYVMQEKSALKRKIMEGLIVVLLAFGVNILLNRLIFQIPVADGMSYMGIFGAEPLWSTFISNLSYYFKVLEYFFTPFTHHWQWATLIMHAMALAFIILGFINHLVRKFNFIDILLLLYLGVILIYPYRHSGFRFLLPIIPYLMYYMVLGMNAFRFDFTLNRNVKILTLGILALSLYLNTFLHIQSERNRVIPGPQEETAIAAFDYIRTNTPPDASIVFFKPRVLALYASRLSMSNKPDQDPGIVSEQFEKMGVNYFLIHADYSDPSLKQFVTGNPDWIQLVWENEKFKLYQRVP
ncbi:MAG: hypothetical protein U9R60_05780, partial [Bacteroidota bacterium]|nr:hypothetical protein [Bacteroidota bacterium]